MSENHSPQELADQAKSTYQSGDYPAAAQGYAMAAIGFAEAGDTLMSAEMKNNQSVALLRSKQASQALEAAKGTEVVFANSGDDRRQGMALANQASALEALKQHSDAVDFFSRAAAALEKGGEFDLRLEVMQLLAALYFRRFKFYDAIITLQSGFIAIKDPTPKQRFIKKILFLRL